MTNRCFSARLIATVALAVCAAGPCVSEAYAQGRAGRPGAVAGRQGPGRQGLPSEQAAEAGISPADLQELMDAMVVLQAERELELSAEQYPQFLTRLRGMQTIRRRADNQRNRALVELRRLTQAANRGTNGSAPPPDEAQLRERLKALDDAEAQAAADLKQARGGIDQILNVRQQVRFRLLEEQIERRKLELFARSRQPARPK